jgi:ferredoxin-NADP reductase
VIVSGPFALRVRAIEPLSPTLKHLFLEPADGGLLPTSAAGAHLALTLTGADRPLRNAYSLVSPPGERSRYELIVRRVEKSRGGSAFIHDLLTEGAIVHAGAPANYFPLQTKARKHLLIGGGVGITPLLSFLPALRATGQRMEMHQFGTAAELPVFEKLLTPHGGYEINLHAGRSAIDITALLARQPLGTHVYVCGPQGLMDMVQAEAARLGWPASKVHRENFGAAGGEPFTIRLARSGRDVAVEADETMLEAMEGAGVPVPSLCRGGVCGECLTRVIEGVPDHRDDFLSPEEKTGNSLIMPCVSRAKTPTLAVDW